MCTIPHGGSSRVLYMRSLKFIAGTYKQKKTGQQRGMGKPLKSGFGDSFAKDIRKIKKKKRERWRGREST